MVKEQMKQKTKIKNLPIISVRFQWGTGGEGVNAYVQFFHSYWTLSSFPFYTLRAPVTPKFYPECGFCEDTAWQEKTSG